MLTQVDKCETHLVQKITNFDRTEVVRFQTVPVDSPGNFNTVECFDTLQGAREAVGLAQPATVTADKPSPKAAKAAKAAKASAASEASLAKKTGRPASKPVKAKRAKTKKAA